MRNTVLAIVWLLGLQPLHALTIRFTEDNSNGLVTDEVRAGFRQAASIWERTIGTEVTVDIGISVSNLGANVIGQANSGLVEVGYADYADLYRSSASTAVARRVAAALPAGGDVRFLVNNVPDLLGGTMATKSIVSSSSVLLTRAQLKALGGDAGGSEDARIEFNVGFAFDYDRTNGIDSGKMDFVGVAAHEIGHALGFVSFVDQVDSGDLLSTEVSPTSLDLLRYSAESLDRGIPDLSAGTEGKFIRVGDLQLGMSTGSLNGNGWQASHFLPGVGLMRPAVGYGMTVDLAAEDYLAFEALGWQVVPEPSAYGLTVSGVAFAFAAVRRRLRRPPVPGQRGCEAERA